MFGFFGGTTPEPTFKHFVAQGGKVSGKDLVDIMLYIAEPSHGQAGPKTKPVFNSIAQVGASHSTNSTVRVGASHSTNDLYLPLDLIQHLAHSGSYRILPAHPRPILFNQRLCGPIQRTSGCNEDTLETRFDNKYEDGERRQSSWT